MKKSAFRYGAHLLLLSICLAGFSVIFGSTQDLLFEAGSKAYLEGDWSGALKRWQQIESSGYHSGGLYYNMGNAFFKLDELGNAILYWEKAVVQMGEDGDLAANLQIARARLVDKLDEPVRLPVWHWFDRLRNRFSAGSLCFWGIALSFLLFATLAMKRWVMRNLSIRRLLRIPIWVFLILLVFDLAFIALKARDDMRLREGILLVDQAEVLSAPAQGTGKLLFTLHEGTKVRIYRKLEGWYEISAGKDRQGWIRREALGVI